MSVLCLAVVGSGEGGGGKGKGWREWGRDGRKRREGIGRDGNGEEGKGAVGKGTPHCFFDKSNTGCHNSRIRILLFSDCKKRDFLR